MTQSIPTGQIDKSKKLFIASGVLAVIYAVWTIVSEILGYSSFYSFYSQFHSEYFTDSFFLDFLSQTALMVLAYISFFLFGIYCIVRRSNDITTTVLAGLLFLFRMIDDISRFNFRYIDIVTFLLDLGMLILLLLLSFTSRKNKNTAIALWIISLFLSPFTSFATALANFYRYYYNTSNLLLLFYICVFIAFIACFGQACITSSSVAQASKPLTLFDGYCDMTKHVLLLLFTFGIWQYLWIYRITEYLNAAFDGQKRNPVTKLLLCMFVPFYYIYWVYQSAKRIDALARQNGVASDISTVSTVLAIFIGFVPPILMQSKLNQICASKGYPTYAASPAPQPAYQAAPQPSYQPQSNYQPQPQTNYQPQSNYQVPAAPAQPTASDTADELRKLKSLLDDGIITPEEFDAKKKQILGL